MSTIDKDSDDYIIGKIETTINDLVRPKYKMKRYYEYYYGYRNEEQYRYLEENYGIGSATSVQFTPLIKNHVDFLVGQYMSQKINTQVAAKDKDTITKIGLEKAEHIQKALNEYYLEELKKGINEVKAGRKMNHVYDKNKLDEIENAAAAEFISSFEKAAQDILEYLNSSNEVNMRYKRQCMMYDLLIAGMCFSRAKKTRSGENITIEVYNPLNVFFDPCPDSPNVKQCNRIVIRKWMTKHQILSEYGNLLTDDDIDEINDIFDEYDNNYHNYIYVMPNQPMLAPNDLDGYRAVVPGYPNETYDREDDRLIPVYEVEWLDYDINDGKDKNISKKDYKHLTYRYKGVRICNDLYIPIGKDVDVCDRTKDNPAECHLSVSGTFLLDRNNNNFSLVGSCMHLQDKYDVTCFLRDTLIANSGTVGTKIDISMLPTALGDDMDERIKKFIAYTKAGIKLFDSSMESSATSAAGANTNFGTYDESVQANSIAAFKAVLSLIEADMSKITGVFGVALGDAKEYQVGTASTELRSALYIAKRFYSSMDMAIESLLFDSLNLAKKVWKNGKTGAIITGKNSRFFEVLPESYTITDFDIHLCDTITSIEENEEMTKTKQLLIQQQALDPTLLPAILESTSLSELRDKIQEAVDKKTNYTQIITQLTQQVEQSKKQIQELQAKNDDLEKEKEKYVMDKIAADKDIARQKNELEWFKARSDAEYNRQRLEIERKK